MIIEQVNLAMLQGILDSYDRCHYCGDRLEAIFVRSCTKNETIIGANCNGCGLRARHSMTELELANAREAKELIYHAMSGVLRHMEEAANKRKEDEWSEQGSVNWGGKPPMQRGEPRPERIPAELEKPLTPLERSAISGQF